MFEQLEKRQHLSVSLIGSTLLLYGTAGADSISFARDASGMINVNDNGNPVSHHENIVTQIFAYGYGGNDLIHGSSTIDRTFIVYGGSGNDTLRGTSANDSLYGDAGDDCLVGRLGNDLLSGGSGIDTADYSSHTSHLALSLDGVANDTGVGTDNIVMDVENVHGGSGNDTLTGNAFNNVMHGGGGDDWVYGLGGDDDLEGGVPGIGNGNNDDGDDYVSGGEGNDDVFAADFGPGGLLVGGPGNDRLYGRGGDDSLSGSSGDDSLYGNGGDDTLSGSTGDDSLYGHAGADALRGGSDADRLYGDTGNDSLWGDEGDDYLHGGDNQDELFGGGGIDTLLGGTGNDTLVSIGGGQSDELWGETGTDSFWADSEASELLHDDSASEAAAGNVHRVSSFLSYRFTYGSANPADWNTVPVSRDLTGQDLVDPTNGSNYQDFSDYPLFPAAGPNRDDIDQNGLADCYYLATLSAVADVNANRIRQSVVSLGDGSYAVRFFNQADEVYVRVDGDLPTNPWGNLLYAGLGTEDSMWVAVMEKAWAFFRAWDGDYLSTEWGNTGSVFAALGVPSTTLLSVDAAYTATNTASDLWDHINGELMAGKAVTTGTPKSSPFLVGSHAYSVTGAFISLNTRYVVVRNPWGAAGDPNAYITLTASQLMASITGIRSANV